MSNYATKPDLINPTGVDTSQFAKKDNLANLKPVVAKLNNDKLEKLDIDMLIPFPTGLSKLSNAVKNDVVKKTIYNGKIKNIDGKIPSNTS